MGKPRKFASTIYCGNCRNVGEYWFRCGVILHEKEAWPGAEYRNRSPESDGAQHTIRLDRKYDGKLVACKFCRCSTALHLRLRDGDVALREALEPEAVAMKSTIRTEGGNDGE